MTGREFVACAERLVESSDEADLRSAVSRAYYGAFHELRSLFRKWGVGLPRTEQVHVKMEFCLRDCRDPVAVKLGNQLGLLRAKRKMADYDLDDKRHINSTAVENEVKRAREVVEATRQSEVDAAGTFRL